MSVQLKEEPGFGAIESAVRETARGRAFLEEYARRMRQSDVLTLLAMVARLERWSEEQAALLAKIEIHETTERSRTSAVIPGAADDRESSRSYVNAGGNTALNYDRLTDDTIRRVENLVTLITDLDRRRESLRLQTQPAETVVGLIDAAVIDHEVSQPEQQAIPAISWNQCRSPLLGLGAPSNDDDVLDEIAKALE